MPVSIHAPARGATVSRRKGRPECDCFNPRAREGRDELETAPPVIVRGFNPRAREGRDFRREEFRCGRRCFNPRAREGRDACAGESAGRLRVSIHAPARGATTW